MGMTIDEVIKRYKNDAEWERSHNNTDYYEEYKQIAEWLEKYQKIEQIYQKWNEVNDFSYNQAMREIGEVMEDKSEESNGGTYSKNILQGCKRAY